MVEPLDLDALKRAIRQPVPDHWEGPKTILALIAELEDTRVERDRMCRDNHVYGARWQKEHARAERAEAEKIRLIDALRTAEDKWLRAEAAIARVEALAAQLEAEEDGSDRCLGVADAYTLRAALRGDDA